MAKPKANQLQGIPQSELERAEDKIMVWFFAFPESEFTLNDLCEKTNTAKTTANTVVLALEKEGFLTHEVLGKRVWRIRANPQHYAFKTHKIPFNLRSAYLTGILAWANEYVPGARSVTLFGSYRWGEDTEKSDIDIAVEVLTNEELRIIPLTVAHIGYRKNVAMNVHVFSRNKIDLNLFANIANGIVLHGFLEVRP